jgi:glutamate transport system substrate-binding protein
MTRRRTWFLPLLLVMALVGAACGDDDDETATTDTTDGETTTTEAAPEFPAGSTMAELQEKGKIVVGTKFNQLGSGLKNPTTGELEGFDIEIAKLIAVGIFGGTVEDIEDKIEFKETISGVREAVIQGGEVDVVIATYTINDNRKKQVDFAGPYVIDGQTVMVAKDNTTIKALTDLNGKKVCSGRGSTTPDNLKNKQVTPSELVLRETYPECADELRQGRVEAVVTDRGILLGLAASSNDAFKLLDIDVSEEPLGIGLKKGDDAFRDFLNDRLEEIYASGEWAAAYEATLGELGLTTPEPPAVDRYASTGTATTLATTTSTAATTTTTVASTTTTG